jgi:ribosome-associated protein
VKRGPNEAPSKTRRKRDADALQRLGEELAELPVEVLATLGLPDRLQLALEEYSRIPSHEARRRQRQFIGRLMREVEPEPLQAFLDERRRPHKAATQRFRLTEQWRDRLLAGGAPALEVFIAAHPGADRAALGEAVRAAQDGRSGAPKRLFRMIHAILAPATGANRPPHDDALLE